MTNKAQFGSEHAREPAPDTAALFTRALSFHQAGLLSEAERLYHDIAQVDPQHADALHMLGVLAYRRGDHVTALSLIDQALSINPHAAAAHNNRGVVLAEIKRLKEAVASYERAIALAPDYVDAVVNRGNALKELARFDAALASYERAIALNPSNAAAFNKRGNVLVELRRPGEAVASYDRAVALKPDFSEAFNNRGVGLAALRRFADAVASYDRALALKPDYADAWSNRGQALADLARYDEAVASYDRAIALKPDMPYLFGFRMHAKMHACDWTDFAQECEALNTAVASGSRSSLPFHLLPTPASPGIELQCARRYVVDSHPASPKPLWTGERYRHDRIRLAYVSGDFHDHATAHLMAGLFEHHDKARFETIAMSFGPAHDSAVRQRLMRSFDRFVDVHAHSDRAVAEHIRRLEVDIAVDLKGFTQGSRTDIFAKRPAPVQVSYLGYPGTMGADYIDYLIADRVVLPDDLNHAFCEKVVRLPDSYQVNDARRRIAAIAPSRADAGLPQAGLVFCCFNNNYKITPDVFDVWMRLLRQVEGSVLWLFAGNPGAPVNLRREAVARGVAAERLIFAPMVAAEDHLARHRLADLFLDTLYYNAHTSASDALWAGLPVVTCLGAAFASRVAGSLLDAVGLPELIAHSLAEYEALALKLARDPASLSSIKQKLARHRDVFPLFNTGRFTRHIEAAYATMWQRAQRGEPPQSFDVAAVAQG
jgi:protein O-GlcNAc transferase